MKHGLQDSLAILHRLLSKGKIPEVTLEMFIDHYGSLWNTVIWPSDIAMLGDSSQRLRIITENQWWTFLQYKELGI